MSVNSIWDVFGVLLGTYFLLVLLNYVLLNFVLLSIYVWLVLLTIDDRYIWLALDITGDGLGGVILILAGLIDGFGGLPNRLPDLLEGAVLFVI